MSCNYRNVVVFDRFDNPFCVTLSVYCTLINALPLTVSLSLSLSLVVVVVATRDVTVID